MTALETVLTDNGIAFASVTWKKLFSIVATHTSTLIAIRHSLGNIVERVLTAESRSRIFEKMYTRPELYPD